MFLTTEHKHLPTDLLKTRYATTPTTTAARMEQQMAMRMR